MWICPICGNQNTDESRYCTECGSVSSEATTSYAGAEPPTVYQAQPDVPGPVRVPLVPKPKKSRGYGWMLAVIAALALLCLGLALFLTVHHWQPATCTQPETCSLCGRTRGEALGHDWGPWVTVSEPTAQEPGLRSRSCRNDPTHTEQEEIPPLGGTEAETEDTDGALFSPASPTISPTPEPAPPAVKQIAALSSLTPVRSSDKGGFVFYSYARDNQGREYDNAYGGCIADTDNWADYNLNGDYTRFSGTVYLNYDFRDETAHRVKLTVYGDGELLYTSPIITTGLPPQHFELDVSGVRTLRIVIYGNDYLRLSDCVLTLAD